MRKLLKSPYVFDALVLFVLTTAFCLHYYNDRFIFQGDVYLNLYMHGNPDLFHTGWDPYAWGYLGWYPIFGAMFPLNALMHLIVKLSGGLPVVTLRLLQANAVISLFLLAYFSYLLLRRLGISRIGGVLGSVLVTSTGFHIQTGVREFDLFYLHSFMFVPLTLLALDKAFKEKSVPWATAGGLFIGLSLLGGGNVPMFMYVPYFIFVYMIDRPLRGAFSARGLLRAGLYLAIASAVGMAVGAAMVVPSMKYMDLSYRSFDVSSRLIGEDVSMSPYYTIMTSLFRDWWPRGRSYNYFFHELNSFVGFPALVLVSIGLVRPWRSTRGKWYMALLGVGALMSMHVAYMPGFFQDVFHFTLTKMSIRYPYRFFMLLLLPAAYFAGSGLDHLMAAARSRRHILFELLLGALSLAYAILAVNYWFSSTPPELKTTAIVAILLSIFFVVLLVFAWFRSSPLSRVRTVVSSALVSVFFVFHFFSMPDLPAWIIYSDEHERVPSPMAVFYPGTVDESLYFLYEDPEKLWMPLIFMESGPFRIFNPGLVDKQNHWAPMNGVDIAFEPTIDPAASVFMVYYFSTARNNIDSPLIDLYNVRYLKLPWYSGGKYRSTWARHIYSNPYAFDRFFVARGARFFGSDREVFKALRVADRDTLRNTVFIVSPENRGESYSLPHHDFKDSIRLIEMSPGLTSLEVELGAPGLLVASDPWFPAWTAEVDGKEADIMRAYGAFRAVFVEGGRHRVVFRFFDAYTFWGRIISGVLLAVAVGAFAFMRFSRTRASRSGTS